MLDTDVVEKTDLTDRIFQLETPAFFIHGEDDEALYPKNSKVLYENNPGEKELCGPRKELVT